jgi:hypothetical protein
MSEHEDFLSRWSRRKREAGKNEAVAEKAEHAVETPRPPDAAKAQEPVPFDAASLPSIDSIDVATDIRAFLAENVPPALKHAALRRAWAADPAIRDFVGLQENDWDFTKPETIPGFGTLDPNFDVAGAVRTIFGEGPKSEVMLSVTPPSPETTQTAQIEGSIASEGALRAQPDEASQANTPELSQIVQRNYDPAPQQGDMTQRQVKRRSHGGALPQEFPDHNV